MLDLQGVTVRADAIAEIIIEKGGDYCFPVKANQPTLLADLKLFFDADPDLPDKNHSGERARTYY